MLDKDNHIIDPATGFAKHIDTGHIIGLEQAPPMPTRPDSEYPKWVVPHDSQIVRTKVDGAPDHVVTPGWAQSHVNRSDGVVTVLVANEDEENLATGEYQAAAPDTVPAVDELTKRQVRADVARLRAAQSDAAARDDANKQDVLEAEEAARRTAENQERLKRENDAAAELAAAQRERLAEKLGGPNDLGRPVLSPTPRREATPPVVPGRSNSPNTGEATEADRRAALAGRYSDPPGWDPQTMFVKSADGSIDKQRTNEERAKRGLVPVS